MDRQRTTLRAALSVLMGMLALAGLLALPASPTRPTGAAAATRRPALPIVFVHGASGSGAQYQTQAQRFASNGYPNLVTAIDRISASPDVIYPVLDEFFDEVLEETGDRQLYVVGHSQGVAVMNGYLNSSPERAARVARYVGIDSASGPSPDVCPGGRTAGGRTAGDGEDGVGDAGGWVVPCMGVWGRGDPRRRLGPDDNVQFADQGHVEVVGSAESFAAQHRFFTGRAPRTTLVLPEPPGRVTIAGRALSFPANTGLAGSTLQVWEVDRATGARRGARPRATIAIGEDGDWGPVRVDGRRHYELALDRDGSVSHFYFEPFLRSDHLVRLNVSPADSALARAIERGDRHSAVVVQRQKEWWGESPTGNDTLDVSTDGAPPLGVVNAATAPVTGSTIAIVTFDAGSDGVSHTDALLPLGAFLSGVDVFYPAADPPDGTITLTHAARGEDRDQVVNAANWASTGHGLTVSFRDWTQDIDSWDECLRARPSPCRPRSR